MNICKEKKVIPVVFRSIDGNEYHVEFEIEFRMEIRDGESNRVYCGIDDFTSTLMHIAKPIILVKKPDAPTPEDFIAQFQQATDKERS